MSSLNNTNDIDKNLNEDIFIALFNKSAHEYLREEQISNDNTSDVLSDSCNKKIKKLINEQLFKENAAIFIKRFSKVAAAILIVIALCSITIVSVEAFRIPVFNLFINTNQSSTDISVQGDTSSISQPAIVEPSYIPIGYELVTIDDLGGILIFLYTNDEGVSIYITRYDIGSDFSIDTENAKTGYVDINGYEALYSIKNDITLLAFRTSNYAYTINAPIDLKEAVKIAESIN